MTNIYQNFDFKQLYSPDFKEDSVREVLILPILAKLGYNNTQIVRSKSLKHPFVRRLTKNKIPVFIGEYVKRWVSYYLYNPLVQTGRTEFFTWNQVEKNILTPNKAFNS